TGQRHSATTRTEQHQSMSHSRTRGQAETKCSHGSSSPDQDTPPAPQQHPGCTSGQPLEEARSLHPHHRPGKASPSSQQPTKSAADRSCPTSANPNAYPSAPTAEGTSCPPAATSEYAARTLRQAEDRTSAGRRRSNPARYATEGPQKAQTQEEGDESQSLPQRPVKGLLLSLDNPSDLVRRRTRTRRRLVRDRDIAVQLARPCTDLGIASTHLRLGIQDRLRTRSNPPSDTSQERAHFIHVAHVTVRAPIDFQFSHLAASPPESSSDSPHAATSPDAADQKVRPNPTQVQQAPTTGHGTTRSPTTT